MCAECALARTRERGGRHGEPGAACERRRAMDYSSPPTFLRAGVDAYRFRANEVTLKMTQLLPSLRRKRLRPPARPRADGGPLRMPCAYLGTGSASFPRLATTVGGTTRGPLRSGTWSISLVHLAPPGATWTTPMEQFLDQARPPREALGLTPREERLAPVT